MSKIFEALRKVQAEVSRRADDAGPAKEVDKAPASKSQEHSAYVDLGVPESFVAEIVSMRYSLESKISRERRALVFTCSVRGEGVSTVSRLYSQILVKDPVSKVVLVDSNTHHPSAHNAFGLEMGPGLTDLLAGRNKLEECLHPTDNPRLQVMPVGTSMIAPMLAFASEALKKMIADSTIVSPMPGIVTHKAVEQGEYVGPGTTLLTIADLATVRLEIFIPELELGKIGLGQSADVKGFDLCCLGPQYDDRVGTGSHLAARLFVEVMAAMAWRRRK